MKSWLVSSATTLFVLDQVEVGHEVLVAEALERPVHRLVDPRVVLDLVEDLDELAAATCGASSLVARTRLGMVVRRPERLGDARRDVDQVRARGTARSRLPGHRAASVANAAHRRSAPLNRVAAALSLPVSSPIGLPPLPAGRSTKPGPGAEVVDRRRGRRVSGPKRLRRCVGMPAHLDSDQRGERTIAASAEQQRETGTASNSQEHEQHTGRAGPAARPATAHRCASLDQPRRRERLVLCRGRGDPPRRAAPPGGGFGGAARTCPR